MSKRQKLTMAILPAILIAGVLGIGVQPAEAASCAYYHTVARGQSLSGIGAYYGVSWTELAQINGIKSPYTIYAGQQICIPAGSYQPYWPPYRAGYPYPAYASSSNAWNFSVVGAVHDQTVTIRTYNFPDNVWFEVEIGCLNCGSDLVKLADLDTDAGGAFNKVFEIPSEYAGYDQLVIRLTQPKKGISIERIFTNATYYQK